MPPRNRNRINNTPTAPTVRSVGDWIDVSAHTIPGDEDEGTDPQEFSATMLRISSIKSVQLKKEDDYDENVAFYTWVSLKGEDEDYQFAGSAYEPIRRRILGAAGQEVTMPEENTLTATATA